MIYNYMCPYSTARTAALVAAGTGKILNKTNKLVNFGYGVVEISRGRIYRRRD